MSHCNTDKFNYFWICQPLARCTKRGSSLPLGTPMEIDFTSAYLHYPLPQCSKIVTPIIFSISYELFRLPSAKVPQDYQLLRTFVWKSWSGTMGHLLIRLFMFHFILFIFHVVKTTKSVNLNLNQNWTQRKNDFFKFNFHFQFEHNKIISKNTWMI